MNEKDVVATLSEIRHYLMAGNPVWDVEKVDEAISRAICMIETNNSSWIPVSEKLPEESVFKDGYHDPSKYVLVQMKSGSMHVSRYWSRDKHKWPDLQYPTYDKVVAWMPLPKPYKGEKV